MSEKALPIVDESIMQKFCMEHVYNSDNSKNNGVKYVDISNEDNNHPSYFLRLRDLEDLLNKYKPDYVNSIADLKSLDYGCGTGRPTRHLKQIGIKNVIGCDINETMIKQSRIADPTGEYIKLDLPEIRESSDQRLLPFDNEQFDYVQSCMVIFETGSEAILQNMLNESSRVLRRGGLFFLIKSPKQLYSSKLNHKWKFFDQHFPENADIKNGSAIRLGFFGMIFNAFYWENDFLVECCKKANLKHILTHDVLGDEEKDGIEWLDEKTVATYIVMIFKKE